MKHVAQRTVPCANFPCAMLKTNFIATFVTAFVYYSKNSLYGRIIMIKSIQSLSIFEKFERSDFGI